MENVTFTCLKVAEGGRMSQVETIRLLKSKGIKAKPTHSPYVGQYGILVTMPAKEYDMTVAQVNDLLFG